MGSGCLKLCLAPNTYPIVTSIIRRVDFAMWLVLVNSVFTKHILTKHILTCPFHQAYPEGQIKLCSHATRATVPPPIMESEGLSGPFLSLCSGIRDRARLASRGPRGECGGRGMRERCIRRKRLGEAQLRGGVQRDGWAGYLGTCWKRDE